MSLLELFCLVDEFCQAFFPEWQRILLTSGTQKRQRKTDMSYSEIMTLLLWFQQSRYRDFKNFYIKEVLNGALRVDFPHALSYTRFVSLIHRVLIPLSAFLQSLKADFTGIGFVDSTSIIVCQSKRISQHKVFKEIAKIGKTTKGWFDGFKLHFICNHRGEICSCRITPGNVNDREPVDFMSTGMLGKLFGDKGYISQPLNETLLQRGLQLITSIRKNMENRLLLLFDKLLLRKRSLIETINNQLKNVFQLEHTRHRSPVNGLINILAAVVAYILYPHKPSLEMPSSAIQALQVLSLSA
ncbi:MAG: IS982 family transposase [Proteobacteria bacterium]|nr:IS982 family transposase [Pseudomonadota bacterium]